MSMTRRNEHRDRTVVGFYRKGCAALTAVLACLPMSFALHGQTKDPAAQHKIYAGNTLSHTMYTWSHGEQYLPNRGCAGILVYGVEPASSALGTWNTYYVASKNRCATIYVINSWQYPSQDNILKPDWQKVQGPASVHAM
jgi:hypothetical protein